jgi:hypothetical protein
MKKQIEDELANAKTHLHIVTAYCKMNAIQFIEKSLKSNIQTKKLLVRFRFDDIIKGASDLQIYEYCKKHSWEMYVNFNMHAKTYVFDRLRCIVGSANLTSSGVGLIEDSNTELSVLVQLPSEEMKKIETMFESSILITDELYSLMKKDTEGKATDKYLPNLVWSKEILQHFKPKVRTLFTYELPNCDSLSNLKHDSLDFLELQSTETSEIAKKLMQSNAYRWLVEKLKQMSDQTDYFGHLSQELHNAIINDPGPYRKEVKQLLDNLLNWIVELDIKEVKIDRPNHTRRISLTKPDGLN